LTTTLKYNTNITQQVTSQLSTHITTEHTQYN